MGFVTLSFGIHAWASCPSLATLIPVLFWKSYYFIYSHRLLLFIGLVVSRSLTYSAIVSVLSWLLTSNGDDIVKPAILKNACDVLSSIFVVFMAYAADSFIGRFKTLFFSNIAYIVALVLFWKLHSHDEIWILVVTLVLLALGTSGSKILQDALRGLVTNIDKSADPNGTQSDARTTIWYRVAYMLGYVLAIFIWVFLEFDSSWKSAFFICIITMTLAVMISGFGHKVYHQSELTERHLGFLGLKGVGGMGWVINRYVGPLMDCYTTHLPHPPWFTWIKRWQLWIFSRQDTSSKIMDISKGGNEGITLEVSTGHLDVDGEEKKSNSSYKQEDKVILKSILKMIPMCVVFSVLSLISATGSTFYLQQYSNLNTDSVIAVQFYSLVEDSLKFAIPFIYGCCFPKNEKVKIGVGIVCGVASCICAWQLEIYRLKEVRQQVDDQGEDTYTSISFLWLVPQFFLLGCMEGLIDEGLLKFYYSQTKEEQHFPYVEEYIALVMGIGKLLNIFLILIFRGWFRDSINHSRLDKYYLVLVILSSANFITYCCIVKLFYKVQELTNGDQDFKNDELPEDHVIEANIDIRENQLELDKADLEQGEPVGNNPDLVKVVKFVSVASV